MFMPVTFSLIQVKITLFSNNFQVSHFFPKDKDIIIWIGFLLLAGAALNHGFLCELSISLPAQGTGQALVPLLVTAVTHRVVQVPPRTGSTARRSRTTVTTHSTVLPKQTHIFSTYQNKLASKHMFVDKKDRECLRFGLESSIFFKNILIIFL